MCGLQVWSLNWSARCAAVQSALGTLVFLISLSMVLLRNTMHFRGAGVERLQRIEGSALRSGRFVKQDQCERWRAKRKLVSAVQAPRVVLLGPGLSPPKKLRLYMQNPVVHFCPQCRPQCVLKHVNNGNAVAIRFGSFSTMGNAFPRVLPRNGPRCKVLNSIFGWGCVAIFRICQRVH